MAQPKQSLARRLAAPVKRALVSLLQLRDSPESIAFGAAVGMFIGLTPSVGFQTVLALLASIHWRVNRTAALATIFVSNPFTTVPVYAVDYVIGKAILRGGPNLRELVEAARESHGLHARLGLLLQFGWPLMLGGIILGLVFAAPTYMIVLKLLRNERRVLGVDLTGNVDARLVARWRWRPLVLASRSLRREMLLRDAGLWFEVIPPEVDETLPAAVPAWRAAEELAVRKARWVARVRGKGIILGADTLVEVDGEILGKPSDSEEARRMLRRLSGRPHRVITGVALVDARTGEAEVGHASTELKMKDLAPEQVASYVASGEGVGKAGGYALQESGDRFVESIEGSISNVVGLPLELVQKLLRRWESEHKRRIIT